MTTPIIKSNFTTENGIYIKRDDLLPFSFGGNKVRIAEEYFKDMQKNGCDCIIGYGNARSNLCRIIANMSRKYNVKTYIISPCDDDGVRRETTNSLIVKACGVQLISCLKENVAQTVEDTLRLCCDHGYKPYYINGHQYGEGNEVTPMLAYVKAYKEIQLQKKEMGIDFDYIFCAVGTGMTYSGLLAGKEECRGKENIVGISIAREVSRETKIIQKFLKCYFGAEKNINFELTDKYLMGGYGECSNQIVECIKREFLIDGVPLDTTYTGKAFYGMNDYLSSNQIKDKKILFIHTGGTPLFFDKINMILGEN